MKIPTLTSLAVFTLVNGQITSWGNGTVACLKPGGSFCLGDSLATDYIVKCDDKGVAQVSSCCDILAAKFPLDAPGTCWQTSPSSGDAVCEKNCIAYCESDTFVLPTQQCTPSTTQTPSGAATPCPPGVATTPLAPGEPQVTAPGIPGEPTAPGIPGVPTNAPPVAPGQPDVPATPVPGQPDVSATPVPGQPPIPPPAGSGPPLVEPSVTPTAPTASVPGGGVPTGTATGPGGVPAPIATPPSEGTEPPMIPTAGAPVVEQAGVAMAIVGLAAVYLL
ncbi:hypothetical protein MCOR25_010968 [Pyricularia grisea]|nr:hypothetical protein MCOR25_010968 [Pyricularia grisea]